MKCLQPLPFVEDYYFERYNIILACTHCGLSGCCSAVAVESRLFCSISITFLTWRKSIFDILLLGNCVNWLKQCVQQIAQYHHYVVSMYPKYYNYCTLAQPEMVQVVQSCATKQEVVNQWIWTILYNFGWICRPPQDKAQMYYLWIPIYEYCDKNTSLNMDKSWICSE